MSGKTIGWIKAHRKMLEWEWYSDLPVRVVFQHLLLSVQHEDRTFKGRVIKAGERVFSIAKFADECGLSVQQTKTALSKLKSTGEVTINSTNKFSIISITKWADYQASNQQSNQQSTCEATSKATTSKETKEINNSTPLPPSKGEPAKPQKKSRSRQNQIDRPQDVPEQLWSDFLTLRKQKRAPVTQTALDGFRREAAKANITLAQAITISLERGWQGFNAAWVKPEDIRSAQPPEPPAAPPVEIDGRKITRSSVVRMLREHFETGDWTMQARSVFGPPPGQPGCKVPFDVIQEARGGNLVQFPGVAAA